MTFIIDDGGRSESGFKGDASDCVCRAIAIASGLPYLEVYARLAEGNATQRGGKGTRSAREGISTKRKWFKDYMASIGFEWTPTMRPGMKQDERCYLLADGTIAGDIPQGRLVLSLARHCSAHVNGINRDRFAPGDNAWGRVTIYGYWRLTGEIAK